jgi:hypothetical protein
MCRNFFSVYRKLAVVQLVEALRYKLEGRGFHFSLTLSFRPHFGPGFDPTRSRNEAAGA